MIGILDCRSHDPGQTWAGAQPEMLEFFDRPLLQHAVEQMVQNGVQHCVLITEDTSAVMRRWGTGERWGCTFSAIPPQSIVRFLAELDDQTVMVGRGDCIPCMTGISFEDITAGGTRLIFHQALEGEGKRQGFTGWAVTQPQTLLNQCFATHGANGLLSAQDASAVRVSNCVRCDTPKAFLRAQELVLDTAESAVIFHGMLIRPGVWAARNVTLHPTTRIIGNVYLGENVRIGPNVTLVGPLVVCRDSAIDANSILSDSSVQPCIYLGRGMSLQNDVAIEGVIIRSKQGIVVRPEDPGRLASTDTTLLGYIKVLFFRPPPKTA